MSTVSKTKVTLPRRQGAKHRANHAKAQYKVANPVRGDESRKRGFGCILPDLTNAPNGNLKLHKTRPAAAVRVGVADKTVETKMTSARRDIEGRDGLAGSSLRASQPGAEAHEDVELEGVHGVEVQSAHEATSAPRTNFHDVR